HTQNLKRCFLPKVYKTLFQKLHEHCVLLWHALIFRLFLYSWVCNFERKWQTSYRVKCLKIYLNKRNDLLIRLNRNLDCVLKQSHIQNDEMPELDRKSTRLNSSH